MVFPSSFFPFQLEAFRTLKAEHGYEHGKMCNNFRPTQPINGRDIYYVTC